MPSLPIRWIAARTYCQATEVEDRVSTALTAVVRGGPVTRETLEGSFGNPLVVLGTRLERAEDIRAAWNAWSEAGLLDAIGAGLESRLDDEGRIHFRLDKQRAFEGALTLAPHADAIDVVVKIRAFPASVEEVRRVARSLFQGAT